MNSEEIAEAICLFLFLGLPLILGFGGGAVRSLGDQADEVNRIAYGDRNDRY